ncbi:major facilitator superfamily domain-containing protein [Bisporella sp. PMI_857]|nr:major facilitator superfamily domain-containing protein [Bisporella sp. PMI_857]
MPIALESPGDVSTETNPDESRIEGGFLTEEYSNKKLSLVLECMYTTVVATILVPISASFDSLRALAWLGSTYLIGQATSQPFCGRLTEIFGRRAGLVTANMAFGIGTLICGLTHKQWLLLLGRVLAGLGGGDIYAVSTNICYGAGTGLGGLYGDWINDTIGWRRAFLIQVPLISIGTLLVYLLVKIPKKQVDRSSIRRVDYTGSFTLVTALVLFLIGTKCWSLFLYIERYLTTKPIIPLHLLRNRTILAASLTYCFDHMSAFGITFQFESGLRFLPNSAGQAIAALAVGILIRVTGAYFVLNIGVHILTLIGSGLLIHLSLTIADWYPFFVLTFTGLGFGGMLVINLTAIISSVSREEQAIATSVSFVFRHYMKALKSVFATRFGLSVLAAALSVSMRENKLHQNLTRT